MEPESWVLIEAVATRLRAIRVDAGFHTDAGNDVITELVDHKDEPAAPQISVFVDGPMTITADARLWQDIEIDVTAQGRVPINLDHAQLIAHRLAADIRRALDPRLGQFSPDEFKAESLSIEIVQRPFGAAVTVVQASMRATVRVEKPTT
jgi:hypothetical protein